MRVQLTSPKIISDTEFANFLTNSPLYYKILANDTFSRNNGSFYNHNDYDNKPFKFKCPIEKEVHTFRTKLFGGSAFYGREIVDQFSAGKMPLYFNTITHKLDLVVYLLGVCQSCQQEINFIINVTTDKKWSERESGLSMYIQKIGQFPSFEIEPEPSIEKYLTDEDQGNYKKALTTLSVTYGIGAYAYFRRIIENEIKRIIKDISELEFEGVDKVRQAYKAFETDHQMSRLIDTINKYLPQSLLELGDNPIRLLYEELSGGIHQFSEAECVEKAKSIDILLRFVIKKINEEKYQFKEVREAMSKLRGTPKN